MSYKNEMQTMRAVLLGEGADRRKLDMLVRQGMMSPAALPMLHRGLDKLQAGKTLSPQERDAVAKVVDSLLYIVTGDDTVFQKAKMHTQKNRYQTEEADQIDEGLPPHLQKILDKKGNIDPKKVSKEVHGGKKSDAKVTDVTPKGYGPKEEVEFEESLKYTPPTKSEIEADKKKDRAGKDRPSISPKSVKKSVYGEEVVEETEQLDEYGNYSVGIKGQGGTTVKARSDKEASQKAFKNMGIADRHRKTMPHTVKKVGEETEVEEKIKCDKCDGKGCKHCDDKGYHTEGYFKSLDTDRQEKERLAKRKNTMIANPKTQKVRKVTPERAKSAVKKGFVYAEEWTDAELDALFEMEYKDKFQAMLKKTGKALASMSDDEKKKFFNTVDAAHKAKNEEIEQIDEAPSAADRARAAARRDMRKDSKGMAPVKKAGDLGGTGKYRASKPDNIEKHGGHIVTQMKKAITVGKPVKFKDGSEKVVSKAHAHKYLSKYMSGKPAQKVDMHGAHDSHDAFMKHVS